MLDPIAPMPETVTLYLQQLGFRQQITPGVFGADWDVVLDRLHDQMCITLTAYVLKEQAGPVSEDYVFHRIAQFPRYLPKWLQRRWTRDEAVTLSVTPNYAYPSSVAKIPDLREPVRFVMQSLRVDDGNTP